MASSEITFNCRGCNRILTVDARLKGRKIRCSQCKRLSIIPSSSTANPPEKPDLVNEIATEDAEQIPPDKPSDMQEETTEAPVMEVAASSAPPAGPPSTMRVAHPTLISPAVVPPSTGPESPPDASAPSSSTPPSAPEPVSSNEDELHKRIMQAEQDLAEMSARRDREEVAYSRTITKLTTQLEEVSHQRDQLGDELAVLNDQYQSLESSARQQIESAEHIFAAAKQSIDDFCNEQLHAMQGLREQLRSLTGEEE